MIIIDFTQRVKVLIYILYAATLLLTSVYSYALIDPNLTLFNSGAWTAFRNSMVQFGYYQRELSSIWYIGLVLLVTAFHLYFLRSYKLFKPVPLSIGVGVLVFLSYPFLSHDIFNYMFDAKIVTFYHQNPYIHKALDFPADPWIRFMHWTHRTYPYGPTFLFITLIPSFLGFGKFLVSFVLFKLLYIVLYLLSVVLLNRIDKRYAIFFATSPLVIFEGLVVMHNDFIALALGIIGYWFLKEKKKIVSLLFFLASGGIKYITGPLILLLRGKKMAMVALILVGTILGYLSFFSEVQPWYFLSLFAFLPFGYRLFADSWLFSFGLLLSYYPYVRFGEWSTGSQIMMKHEIIVVFLILNIIYWGLRYRSYEHTT